MKTAAIILAMSWYGWDCCHDSHCRPVLPGEVQEMPGGYSIPAANEFIKFGDGRIKPSKDSELHRCTEDQKPENPTICLYVPALT